MVLSCFPLMSLGSIALEFDLIDIDGCGGN